jgi:hypothetical protein
MYRMFLSNLHSPLPAVLFAGAVGGFVSVQRRIQSVTDHGESLVGLIELQVSQRHSAVYGRPLLSSYMQCLQVGLSPETFFRTFTLRGCLPEYSYNYFALPAGRLVSLTLQKLFKLFFGAS